MIGCFPSPRSSLSEQTVMRRTSLLLNSWTCSSPLWLSKVQAEARERSTLTIIQSRFLFHPGYFCLRSWSWSWRWFLTTLCWRLQRSDKLTNSWMRDEASPRISIESSCYDSTPPWHSEMGLLISNMAGNDSGNKAGCPKSGMGESPWARLWISIAPDDLCFIDGLR